MKTGLRLSLTFSLLIHLAVLSMLVVYGGRIVGVPGEGVGNIKAVLVSLPGKVEGNPSVSVGSEEEESAERISSGVPARLVERVHVPESTGPALAPLFSGEMISEGKAEQEAREIKPEKTLAYASDRFSDPKEAVEVGGDREQTPSVSYSGEEAEPDGPSSPSGSALVQTAPVGSAYAHPGWGEDEAQPWGTVPGLEKPEYPWRSRERGEQGWVLLAVEISSSGEPGRIKILRSSGYKRLDRTAIRAVERSVFTAPQGVASYRKITFNFRLEDPQ